MVGNWWGTPPFNPKIDYLNTLQTLTTTELLRIVHLQYSHKCFLWHFD